jgi:TRAP-type C4-dicarboxylate transport system permease small subunit
MEKITMHIQRLLGILFLVAGALGLAYGGFSYTKETHTADIGSLHMSVDEKKTVNIPMSLGIGFVVVGGLLLMVRRQI